ncbi:MAG TPA: hypothetical protein VEV63_15685 [Streptosporangiaceae bacterium]|nr:hypothetical protein [Streptosporangiaceae bacterium]
MRRPLNSAVIRRDSRLDRTRKLSAWIAGGATAASVGLAGLLGVAIPGHAATAAHQRTSGQTRASGDQRASQPGSRRAQPHAHRHGLSAPSSPPSPSTAPPVVSSGGS